MTKKEQNRYLLLWELGGKLTPKEAARNDCYKCKYFAKQKIHHCTKQEGPKIVQFVVDLGKDNVFWNLPYKYFCLGFEYKKKK